MDFGSILSTITDVANTAGAVAKAVAPTVQQVAGIIQQANNGGAGRNHVFEPQTITATPQQYYQQPKDNTLLYVAGAGLIALLVLKK